MTEILNWESVISTLSENGVNGFDIINKIRRGIIGHVGVNHLRISDTEGISSYFSPVLDRKEKKVEYFFIMNQRIRNNIFVCISLLAHQKVKIYKNQNHFDVEIFLNFRH